MFIPALFDPSFHENGLREVTLTDVGVNFDGDVQFIEGNILPNAVGIEPAFIRTPVFGKAVGKARDMMYTSWIKAGTPGHIAVPSEVILVVNSDDQIVDIQCVTCRDTPCGCYFGRSL